MEVSIRDVAKRAGVSIATVSRVINNSAYVNDEKSNAVKEAMKFYKYEPNQFGRGLVKQVSNTIGVYFNLYNSSLFDNTYTLELFRGIEKVLTHYNYDLLVITDRNERLVDDVSPRFLEYVRQKKIDALIMGMSEGTSTFVGHLKETLETGFNVGYIGERIHTNGFNVSTKLQQFIMDILEKFYRCGHRKIVMVTFDLHANVYNKVMENIGEIYPGLTVKMVNSGKKYKEDSWRDLCAILKEYILDDGYTAITSPTVQTLVEINRASQELNLDLLKVCSVATIEHQKGESQVVMPGVNSFYVNAYEMGIQLATLLVNTLKGKINVENEIIMNPEYFDRGSIQCMSYLNK